MPCCWQHGGLPAAATGNQECEGWHGRRLRANGAAGRAMGGHHAGQQGTAETSGVAESPSWPAENVSAGVCVPSQPSQGQGPAWAGVRSESSPACLPLCRDAEGQGDNKTMMARFVECLLQRCGIGGLCSSHLHAGLVGVQEGLQQTHFGLNVGFGLSRPTQPPWRSTPSLSKVLLGRLAPYVATWPCITVKEHVEVLQNRFACTPLTAHCSCPS